jgi:hypothetical protein
MRALSRSGIEGAWIDITNGYFQTGYSDPTILPHTNLRQLALEVAYKLRGAFGQVRQLREEGRAYHRNESSRKCDQA